MHTIIHPTKSPRLTRHAAAPDQFRNPHYECRQSADAMQILAFVPGVEAAGVEITMCGPDLVVTARKAHIVRINWTALHLEGAQLDYQLRLRIGRGFKAESLRAEITEGVLTVTLLKRHQDPDTLSLTDRRVA